MNITTCLFTVLGGMATLGHPSETVRLNQLGYYPQQEKVAVVNAGEVREFTIVDAAKAIGYFPANPDIPLHPLGRIRAGQYWISVTSRYREDIFCWLTAIQWHSK